MNNYIVFYIMSNIRGIGNYNSNGEEIFNGANFLHARRQNRGLPRTGNYNSNGEEIFNGANVLIARRQIRGLPRTGNYNRANFLNPTQENRGLTRRSISRLQNTRRGRSMNMNTRQSRVQNRRRGSSMNRYTRQSNLQNTRRYNRRVQHNNSTLIGNSGGEQFNQPDVLNPTISE
jgi:hypothetical protein